MPIPFYICTKFVVLGRNGSCFLGFHLDGVLLYCFGRHKQTSLRLNLFDRSVEPKPPVKSFLIDRWNPLPFLSPLHTRYFPCLYACLVRNSSNFIISISPSRVCTCSDGSINDTMIIFTRGHDGLEAHTLTYSSFRPYNTRLRSVRTFGARAHSRTRRYSRVW